MKLGDQLFKLRKEAKLSQEQLAFEIGVTRQTISNWELNETSPNPEQLKLLSKTLNVSVDELLGNDVKQVLVEKVSNTEKLAGIIIKILKVMAILFLFYLLIAILSFVFFNRVKVNTENTSQTVYLECKLDDKEYDYLIEIDKDGNILESNGSAYISDFLKDQEFKKGKMLVQYIESYFKDNGGSC